MGTSSRGQIYKCNVCGNIVEVLIVGGGDLVCCSQQMELLTEKTEDEGNEKHVPVIEKTVEGVKVKVGDVAHPMQEEHYIQWIEVGVDGGTYRKYLEPGMEPEATFDSVKAEVTAREYCNVHGLWKSKK